MKRICSRLLILVLAACLLFALASCTIKFGSTKTAAATSASTSDPDVSTGTGDATDGAETNTQNTAEDTEPAPVTTDPATTAPDPDQSGIGVGEDTDNSFGQLHPMPPANP